MMHLIKTIVTVVSLTELSTALPCPDLDLSWGKYTASLISNSQVCKYENVRFASPPVSNLRFQAPQYPPAIATVFPPAPTNVACVQMASTAPSACPPPTLPGDDMPNPFHVRPEDTSCPINVTTPVTEQEDCLFLDIYMPASIIGAPITVPVVVWFYGGGYVVGSKTQADFAILPLYDGEYLASQGSPVIFIAGNYRLGAYGWLAGSHMEAAGQPNAGLLDQRAMLHFVQDEIHQLQGDPTKVSVWGESAGASSVMHHLAMSLSAANESSLPFRSAILQSPAYQWLWDQDQLDENYMQFAAAAGCPDGDLSCLQNCSDQALKTANQDLYGDLYCRGIMPVGPSVDGNLVPHIASYQLLHVNHASLQSILVSHVDEEIPYTNDTSATSFIPLPIRANPTNETIFEQFLSEFAPGTKYAGIRKSILAQYPNSYKDQIERARHLIMDSSFLCNTRYLIDTYDNDRTPTFALNYAFGADYHLARHASDLIPLFWNPKADYFDFIYCLLPEKDRYKILAGLITGYLTNSIAQYMQQFFLGLATKNDPGTNKAGTWPPVGHQLCQQGSRDTCVSNVVSPAGGERQPWKQLIVDQQTPSSTCDFWDSIAQQLTQISSKGVGSDRLLYTADIRLLVDQEL